MSTGEQESWSRVKERLRTEVGEDVYSSWFARMDLEAIEEGAVRLSVPTRFLKSWIQSHYAERVLACWQAQEEKVTRVELIVRSAVLKSAVLPKAKADQAAGDNGNRYVNGNGRPLTAGDPSVHEALGGSPLDPRLTFDTFVVGRSNTLAHAAAKQVASAKRGDAVMFNPLYIHSGVGLGKTHLMHAIGHYILAREKKLNLAYISTDRFINEMINAIRFDRLPSFRAKYRAIDVLLIDDIQFIAGKDRTQEEFFHIFNALHDGQKQIVVSSDCPPRQIPTIEERLHSRFEWGLIADIQPPDIETKIAIVMLLIFTALAEILFHNYWDMTDPLRRMYHRLIFLNNCGVMGGLVLFYLHA